MNILLVLIFSMITLSAFGRTSEDVIFDEARLSASELLYKTYQNKRILLIGTSNHTNYKHYERVLELLELVGNDPDLKFIVMERSHEVSGFYELLSTENFETALELFNFKSPGARKGSLCVNPEWSYTIKVFMPKLREINRKRFPLPPIILKGIEDMPSELINEPMPDIVDGNCKVSSVGSIATTDKFPSNERWGISTNRENQTAKNFKKDIWDELGPHGKVIYTSHYMHMINGFSGCRPSRNEAGVWSTNIDPLTWVTPFLRDTPEAREEISFIINDEKDRLFNPKGSLKLVNRQSLRYPGEDFAFFTKPFKGTANEIGSNIFLSAASVNAGLKGQHFSNQDITELADGVIWNSKAKEESQLLKAEEYLPSFCGR